MSAAVEPVSEPGPTVRAPRAPAWMVAGIGPYTWPVVLVAAVYSAVGRIGFVPTDQGFILAAAHRILEGGVPHRDLISPRPLGTPILHTLDFLLPGPLFETSTVVAIGEVAAYSIVLGTLVYGIGVRRWSPLQSAAVAAAALVNLHRFPLMVWPAIDGLLLVSVGYLLIHRGVEGSRWRLWVGFVLLGAACVVKQSFLPAPVLGMLYVGIRLSPRLRDAWWLRLAHLAAALATIGLFTAAGLIVAFPAALIAHGVGHPARAAIGLAAAGLLMAAYLLLRARRLFAPMLVAAAAGALPVAAYVGAVAALGGLSEMRTQLTDAAPAYGLDAFREVLAPQARTTTLLLVAAVAGLTAARHLLDRRGGSRAAAASLAARLALSGVLVYVVLFERLATGGTWGTRTLLAVAALTVVEAGWRRDWAWAWPAVAVLASAWMIMLSWGYFWPDLAAGSVALAGLATTWHGWTGLERPRRAAAVVTALGAAAVLSVGAVFLYGRWTQPLYLEPPASRVDATLGDVSPAFGQIRADPVTHEYLMQIKQCIAEHPASRVAVLPDNAAIYPAMGLDDPFPIDWFYGPEFTGSEAQLLAAAHTLDQDGHYLVLFQTVFAADLGSLPDLPAATPQLVDGILAQEPPVLAQIRSSLHGEAITCGSFAGVYRP
jgi:hypothetical protein